MDTSLLDDGWSYGRKNFTLLESDNSVSPSMSEFSENTRTGLRGALSGKAMVGTARGLDLLGVVNELAATKGNIEAIFNVMAAVRVADSISAKLVPDQRATLLIERDTGKITLLHAGEGYLYDPANKPFIFELEGSDGGICRGKEVPGTRIFDVTDRDGQRRKLEFEDNWKPEFENKDDKEHDRDPGDLPPSGPFGRQQEEEA